MYFQKCCMPFYLFLGFCLPQLKAPHTKANRIRFTRAFRNSKRVDLSIDCVIESQMGKAFTDSLGDPMAFKMR